MSRTATSSPRAANVSTSERTLSALAGGALALYALARRSPLSLLLAPVGAALVYRGVGGYCALYDALGIDTTAARQPKQSDAEALVDQSSEDSFPASDAPAWTPTTSVGNPGR